MVDLLQELVVFLSDQSELTQNNQMCVTCDTHKRDEASALNIRWKSQAAQNTSKERSQFKKKYRNHSDEM